MSKALALLLAAPLAACTTDTPVTPLAQFQGAQVNLQTAHESALIEPGFTSPTRLTISPPDGDCVRLGDDVTADLDGVRMQMQTLGGAWSSIDSHGCDVATFELAEPLPTTGTSTLLIRDSATTWTITGVDLFANDFALADAPIAGQRARIVWHSAQSITDGAYVQFQSGSTIMFNTGLDPNAVTSQGNVIEVALPADITGSGTLSLNSDRTTQATRCEGPASCSLQVFAGADLPATIVAAPSNPQVVAGDVVTR